MRWLIETTESWDKDLKFYNKKHPSELAALLRNIDRYIAHLNVSNGSKCVEAGYLHHEPGGIVAVDQKGLSGNLQETRAYTYAKDSTKRLYLLKIGNKDSQYSDVEYCKDFGKNYGDETPPEPTPN